jgi:tetratricopeptide (TPR) repeat protein
MRVKMQTLKTQILNARLLGALAATLVAVTSPALRAQAGDGQRLFEAGQYQQVIEQATPDAPPSVVYLAGQSQQKLGATDQAIEIYGRLANRPEEDPWHFIGLSARQLASGDADGALESARHAAGMASDLPEAQYQLGLVLAKRQEWPAAAAAFDSAANLNPSNAYAHYYGGLMHYRASRPDRMAIHFEQFLKLAPEAPERPEVQQIMRTVKGR